MIFRQFLHTSPVGASYLFGCGGQGQCVVVDPVEDIGPYQQVSRETGHAHHARHRHPRARGSRLRRAIACRRVWCELCRARVG